MNQRTVSKQIRDARKSEDQFKRSIRAEAIAHANAIIEAEKKCTHKYNVIMYSAYEGDRSWDYDNAHAESRMCLVCGLRETGYSEKSHSLPWDQGLGQYELDRRFKILLDPISRFETYHLKRGDKEWDTSILLTRKFLDMPLTSVLKWVKSNGYNTWCKKEKVS